MRQIVVVCTLLLIAATIGAHPAAAQGRPGVDYNVQPHEGIPGTRFAFFATGFTPGEWPEFELTQPSGRTVTPEVERFGRIDPGGRADWSWIAPLSAPAGTWHFTIRGSKSKAAQTISFQVTGLSEEMRFNVQPHDGPPATKFAFFATGFKPGERVAVWFNRPDGQVAEADVERLGLANGDGRVDWFWTAPLDAQRGHWQIVAHGVESGVELVIDFTVS